VGFRGFKRGPERIRTAVAAFAELSLATRPQDLIEGRGTKRGDEEGPANSYRANNRLARNKNGRSKKKKGFVLLPKNEGAKLTNLPHSAKYYFWVPGRSGNLLL
jgi:hypothetical protein